MHFYLTAALIAFPSLVLGQLATMVPPPPCLQSCINTYSGCLICTSCGTSAMQACINAQCSYRDVSYAGAYYSDMCKEGKYLSYQFNPPQLVDEPPASCPGVSHTSTTSTPSPTPTPTSTHTTMSTKTITTYAVTTTTASECA